MKAITGKINVFIESEIILTYGQCYKNDNVIYHLKI